MPFVTITELKAHLAEYLRRVQDGERLHVTVPRRGGRRPRAVRTLSGRRCGAWSRPASATWSGEDIVLPDQLPINTGRLLSDIVLEDRGPYWDRTTNPTS